MPLPPPPMAGGVMAKKLSSSLDFRHNNIINYYVRGYVRVA